MESKRRTRLLFRVYLYGISMLALATGASFVVGNYVLRPAVEVPSRPSTAWIAWHLIENADRPELLAHELADLKRRSRIEMTLFEADGRRIASNVDEPPRALPAHELAQLSQRPTHFAEGVGVVASVGTDGKALRYVRVRYPIAELPLGVAAAQLAVALSVLALLSIPLARSVTAPVERLAKLTRAFGAGDLSLRVKSDRRDEIGDLAQAFDEMADRLVVLRRSEKELLANVSHELRTPLARIRLALELVRGGDASRADSYLADIEEDLAELEQLLDGIMTTARLDIARGVAGEALPPLTLQAVESRSFLETARARFTLRHPGRVLGGFIDRDLPALSADPALLRRVLDNLLDNAVKFSEPSDAIELEAVRGGPPDSVVIRVRDRGMGITEADLGRVFEPFFRSDRSRTRSTGGVGLGLAVARRIVEAHGGTISVTSDRSTGTCFSVSVPACPPAPKDSPERVLTAVEPKPV
jgi:two-component system OmpR family sensor kinase